MSDVDVDIVVCGAGVVGLALANLLARGPTGFSVAVVDRGAAPESVEETGLRVSALSPAAQRIVAAAGTWQRVEASVIGPYRRMCVWRDGGPGGAESLQFDAAEQGLDALGCIVENERLRFALWQAAGEADVVLMTGTTPDGLYQAASATGLVLRDGRRVRGRLLVGADGARSWVRERVGVRSWSRDYRQRALVTHVTCERGHEQTAWQRFLPGGPLALLPLADGRASVVWSLPEAEAAHWLESEWSALGRALTDASEAVLGSLEVSVAPAAFPLRAAHARHYSGRRFALAGDAAHQVHPLAGQGVNLGLMDAAVLADVLAAHAAEGGTDAGDERALARYARRRRGDNLATLVLLDGLDRLFRTRHTRLSRLAGRGLGFVDGLAPVKRMLAGHAVGHLPGRPTVAPDGP